MHFTMRRGVSLLLTVAMICSILCVATIPVSASTASNEQEIFEFLVNELDFTPAAACGVLANIYKESTFNPAALSSAGSYGICQWTGGRRTSLQNWCNNNGYDYTTLDGQLHYLEAELLEGAWYNGYKLYSYMTSVENTAEGAYQAGYYWCYNYEIPAARESQSQTRGALARDTYWPKHSDYVAEETVGGFSDVTKSSYYADAVVWAVGNGIASGNGSGEFFPDVDCTRAEALTLLWRAEGAKEASIQESSFVDAEPDAYYYKALLWAEEKGIIKGVKDEAGAAYFLPDYLVGRGEFVTMLFRTMDSPKQASWNPFRDVAKTDFFYGAVLSAVYYGVTTGVNDGIFDPAAACTRGAVVTMLYRFA